MRLAHIAVFGIEHIWIILVVDKLDLLEQATRGGRLLTGHQTEVWLRVGKFEET